MSGEAPYWRAGAVGADLGVAVRLVRDGNAPSELLIEAATTGLVQGLDSPSLRELAGLLVREAPYEGRRLADRALEELGLVAAGQSAANRAVAQSWARALLDDRTGPFVAARAIWQCFTNSDVQLPDLAADFLALEDEWE